VALQFIIELEIAHVVDEHPWLRQRMHDDIGQKATGSTEVHAAHCFWQSERQHPQANGSTRDRRWFCRSGLGNLGVDARQVFTLGVRVDDCVATAGVVHIDARTDDFDRVFS
jgi:hypothetical protein